MLTPEMLQEAHDTLIYGVLRVVFQYEDDFKLSLLAYSGWKGDSYKLERCHIAQSFRVTLKHDDGREKDIYIPSSKVYDWVLKLQAKVLNKGE